MSNSNFEKISNYIKNNFSDEIQKYNPYELYDEIVKKMTYEEKMEIIKNYGGITLAFKEYGDHFIYLEDSDITENYIEDFLTVKILSQVCD